MRLNQMLRALRILSSNGSTGKTGHKFQFGILYKVSEMLIPSTKNEKKTCVFLASIHDSYFSLKNVSTPLTLHCPKCLFHMDNHLDPVSQCHTHESIKWIHLNKHGHKYLRQAMCYQKCGEYFKKKKTIY